jgi:Inner membrane component of T3SS, cytoplasmic domain
MSPDKNNEPIKITLDDLARVETAAPAVPITPGRGPGGAKIYGSVTDAADKPVETTQEERGSILLQGWFYLGLAGLVGATAGWALIEPWFVDGPGPSRAWQTFALIALVVTLQCVAYGVAESIVERSPQKALTRGGLSIPLGAIFGAVISVIAGFVFLICVAFVAGMGAQTARNPAFWVARGIAWMVLGVAPGAVYGIVGLSSKKAMYGILGGVIGAGLGGMLFDPIALLTKGGAASRGVGFALLGLATGIAMGLVESALKDRWLYVTAGPLAGKQFILYKPRTVIGSDQKCDIYLFKDANVLAEHAIVEIAGSRVQFRALGPSYVSGQPARVQVLQSGNSVQIGRYAFRYSERQRK